MPSTVSDRSSRQHNLRHMFYTSPSLALEYMDSGMAVIATPVSIKIYTLTCERQEQDKGLHGVIHC